MARKTTKQLLKSARQLLQKNWIPGSWIVFEDGEDWSPEQKWNVLTDKLGTQANPQCHVCAEGAVYLACALAGEDKDTARNIIDKLNAQAEARYGEGIISVNDGDVYDFENKEEKETGLEDVLKVFDAVEKDDTVHV